MKNGLRRSGQPEGEKHERAFRARRGRVRPEPVVPGSPPGSVILKEGRFPNMKIIRFFLIPLLAGAMILSTASAGDMSAGTAEKLDRLASELEASSGHLMKTGEDVDDIYSEMNWKSIADTFPVRFDLRERGTVTPVRDQDPWGTCWSFATVAASETSILNSLGMTAEEYRSKTGEDMDLSEKHLAWFTARALPELNEYPEDGYPYYPGQAGEGLHLLEGTDEEPLNCGGNYYLATTSLSTGVGILREKTAPYVNSDGTKDREGDWSLPEEERFYFDYELKHANILPSPALDDGEGNYVYNSAATEAIKSELLAGRSVGINFRADYTMPGPSGEAVRETLREILKDNAAASEEEKDWYIGIRAKDIDTAGLSAEELRNAVRIRLRLNGMPEDTYNLDLYDRGQLAVILMSDRFGEPPETLLQDESSRPYLTFTDSDPVVFAHYTYEKVPCDHCVTIVGWDDAFSAETWPEDRRPPADGAWICRNSWGEDWGDGGYFMLSYYDMSLYGVCSFEYVISRDTEEGYLSILGYDNMPAEIISSTLFETPVYAANVYQITEDTVLQYVSALTGDLDAAVTASVYLLNDQAASPTDGLLLGTVTQTFRFAGYHRMNLSGNLLLHPGARISIVVLENVPVKDGTKYALVQTGSLNRTGAETYNAIHKEDGRELFRYAKGVMNPGESFVSFEPGEWTDWSEAAAVFGARGTNVNMAYDNLPVKAYVYPWEQIRKLHDFSERIPAAGGEASICPEDGYLLLDTAVR